jgi:hypothetical protein
LGDYKDIIINMFLDNQDVVDLMLPNPITGYDVDTQLLGSNTIKNSDGSIIFEGQLFPYYYTDGTNQKARTFVLVDDKIPRGSYKETFKDIVIFIYVFTHKSLVTLVGKEKAKYKQKGYKGSCRTDVLSTAIDNILNKSKIFGLKELKIDNVDIFKPSTNDYYGRVLTYTATTENIGGDICG